METYTMKIRDEFIDLINKGIKKREYRLNDESRRGIKVNDVIVLVSTKNPDNFVRTRVTSINHYLSWEEALNKYWKDDFATLYSSLEEAINKCRTFYEKSDVDKFGIITFDIIPIKPPSLKKCCVLLDTNIFIQRESYNGVSDETIELYNWLSKLKSTIYLHSSIKEEIQKNTNVTSRDILLKKVMAYTLLNEVSEDSSFFREAMNKFPKNVNSMVDNKLLYEAYNNNVDYLITNDKEMLRKASALYIRDKVLNVAEYLDLVEKSFPTMVDYEMLKVRKEYFADCDLNDNFFSSLREDYNFTSKKEFDTWFENKKKQGETAYVYRENNKIKGFLYLKTEDPVDDNYEDIDPILPPKHRLKIGTFKNSTKGLRVGERFIKIIFDNALKQKVDEIYVTLFENRREEIDALESLLKKWGFTYWGKKNDGEIVLVKNMKSYDYSKDCKFNFPLVKDNINYFFIPIESEYHTDLFPDYILHNEDISFYSNGQLAHRYALEKVYVSSIPSFLVNCHPGDMAVIYRKGDRWPKRYSSVVTGTVIIESVTFPNSLDEYLKECKNITVFSDEQLKDFYNKKKYRTVIKVIQFDSFDKKITASFLQENGIVGENSGPRTLDRMTSDQFRTIINEAKSNIKKGD